MDKDLIKKKIWEFEFYYNEFSLLNGRDVRVVNLKLRKNKAGSRYNFN